MLKSYFKTAWRNMMRTKGYSVLNISGLAAGMAVALLIGLWASNEYSYDKFLPGYRQLYQARRNFNSNGDTLNFTTTSLKLADALRNQVPEIAHVAESDWTASNGLTVGDKKLFLPGMQTGSDFLQMFQYPLLEGAAGTVLKDPYSIVLTESTAKALFGNEDPVNKTVRFNDKNDLKVTGVLKDVPSNSTLQFNYIVPFSYYEQTQDWVKKERTQNGFDGNAFQVFVQLKPGISYAQVAPKIRDIEKTEKTSRNAMYSTVILQPLANWHLYDNYENGKETAGFLQYVRMFSIIGILVLLIACINFINLTTARSEKRAKEVGIRKSIGSRRKDLILQFLTESFLLTFIAFLLSLLLVQLALPSFNALTGNKISIPYSNGIFWSIVSACVLLTTLIAGGRPAFYLSSFNPVKVLKGAIRAGRAATLSRRVLVVAQFSCSIALIISTIIVYQQVNYAKDRPKGYNSNRLMMSNINSELGHNFTPLKDELLRQGIVESITTSSSPVTDVYTDADINFPGKNPGETIQMDVIRVAPDYFKTLGMSLQDGRDFTGPMDTQTVIFNEAAIRRMRLKQPLGQSIRYDTTCRIVGVVKDALMASPFERARPTMFVMVRKAWVIMTYRLSPNIKTQDAIAKLTVLFNKYNPAYPYSYKFVDDVYAQKFSTETLVGKLAGIFAALAIFISCLGLFGLAAYIAEQRTREIGIRKVLGASVSQVWVLLSKDFILLVLISCAIASPLAFYFLDGWLHQYTYRINIGAGVFFLSAFMAIIIAIATVSFQAIKAAVANPVKSLKTE